MPDAPMKDTTPPTGRKIVLELVREMEERLYPLLYRTLPPSVYHVYLHPDDYRQVEAVASLIIADAQQGLNARVDELNRRARWRTMLTGAQPQIEVPKAGWEIHLHSDANSELGRGELGIVCSLSLPAQPKFESGTPTTRIARTVVTGAIRRSAAAEDSATALPSIPVPPAPAVSTPVPSVAVPLAAGVSSPAVMPPPMPRTMPDTPRIVAEPPRVRTDVPHGIGAMTAERPSAVDVDMTGAGFARLSYVDDQGPHQFVMRKDVVSIGRGGSAHWVDVQVASTTRVSREHCRIRRDASGRFFVQDISSWGTSINGEQVPPYLRQSGDRVEETGQERELPARARIQLADAIVIEFEAPGR
jgi:hypothetical protein